MAKRAQSRKAAPKTPAPRERTASASGSGPGASGTGTSGADAAPDPPERDPEDAPRRGPARGDETIPAGRPGVPNPIDIHVGSRVRLRRTILGMSQERLGEALGLTFQQIQKYERGANRIGASRLYDLSRVLDVPIDFFYEDMPADVSGQSPRLRAGLAESASDYREADPMARRETLELVRAYYKVRDPQVRRRIFDLCKAMAHAEDEEE